MPDVVIQYDDGTTRKVGVLVGDTLVCRRTVSKHLFRGGLPTVEEARRAGKSCWGLDCKVCDGLMARGVVWLEIHAGNGHVRCRLSEMAYAGRVLHMKPHRPQYFLNEQYFVEVS